MAENLNLKPSKGILKNSSSFDIQESKRAKDSKKSKGGNTKWDEMNIMATLHPADKDYGHMKIDEPKTPYNYENLEEDLDVLDAAQLAEKIRLAANEMPKAMQEDDSDEDVDDDISVGEREKKQEFESKRKKHYNEYYAVKLARKLLEQDEDDEEGGGHSQQHKSHDSKDERIRTPKTSDQASSSTKKQKRASNKRKQMTSDKSVQKHKAKCDEKSKVHSKKRKRK